MTFDDLLKPGKSCRVAVVQAQHKDSLLAVDKALNEGLCEFVLIGDRKEIAAEADNLKIPLDGVDIKSAANDEEASFIAAGMASAGEADVVMKGLVHTSVFTIALLNKERKLIFPDGLISHISLFDHPVLPCPFFLTDAAINIAPDINQKSLILKNAFLTVRKLGIAIPEAICIAPVERVNPKISSTVDAAELAGMDWGEALVEGPMALDAALSAEAAEIKGIPSTIAGHPDILLFPELNSANGVYKSFTLTPGCRNAGILAGLKVPVVLTSRSDSEETRYLSLKLAIAGAG